MSTYFNIIAQKASNGKILLMAVVDEEFFSVSELPNIFEVQAHVPRPTIYSGVYPTVKVNVGSIKSREDLKGVGASGIITGRNWYYTNVEDANPLTDMIRI